MLLFGSLGSSCFSSPVLACLFYFTNVSFLPLNKRWNLKKLPQGAGEGAALSQPGPLDLEGAAGAPVPAHCPVGFGRGTGQGRENVCSPGSPEEKEQGFSFGLWFPAQLGNRWGWGYQKHLQARKCPWLWAGSLKCCWKSPSQLRRAQSSPLEAGSSICIAPRLFSLN